jgi:hypothetical protein
VELSLSYLVQEIDGVSHFELENASGNLLLEQSINAPGDEDFWTMPPTIPMSNDFMVTKF